MIYDNPNDIKTITTEALMVGSNDKNPKGIIRVVEMQSTSIGSKINNYNSIIGEFPAKNHYFNFKS